MPRTIFYVLPLVMLYWSGSALALVPIEGATKSFKTSTASPQKTDQIGFLQRGRLGAIRLINTLPSTGIQVDTPGILKKDHSELSANWNILWDLETKSPAIFYGRGISFVSDQSAGAYVQASRVFLEKYRNLFGVGKKDLVLASARVDGGTWYVRMNRVYRNVPVIGRGVDLRFQGGHLVLVRAHVNAALELNTVFSLKSSKADLVAQEELHKYGWISTSSLSNPRLVIIPVRREEKSGYHLAWETRTETQQPRGRIVSFVDAHTGRILHQYNEIVYATNTSLTVQGEHEPRKVGDVLVTSPFINTQTESQPSGQVVITDENGVAVIEVETSVEVTLALYGPYTNVNHQYQADASETVTLAEGVSQVFAWDNTNASITERNVFQAHKTVRERMLLLAPELEWLQTRVPLAIGFEGECNAFWDGVGANFFRESSQCNDTGRIADVVYHEVGHGFHQNIMVGGTWDASVSEGSCDYLAATITGDPDIAPTFFKGGGTGSIRNLEEDRVYPDDIVGESHTDGLIWGGAFWDLRTAMIAEYGQELGVLKADELFAGTLKGGPTLADGYWEVLLADDDDADLSNGSPHVCMINDAFGPHGLGPGSGGGIAVEHSAPGLQQPNIEIGIQAKIFAQFPQCGELEPSGILLNWRLEGETAFSQIPMTLVEGSLDTFQGSVPAAISGSKVQYFIGVEGSQSQRNDPPQAPNSYYEFYVGEVLSVFFDDFESGEEEWTHGYSHAASQPEYADDWQLGTPGGLSGDPDQAFSGEFVWGNDLGAGEYNGAYRPNVTNYLNSPLIDCRGYRGTRLQFRRWLNAEDGGYDQARIRINGQTVWSNADGEGASHHKDSNWFFHDIDIAPWADKKKITIQFEMETDAGLEMGGWNIDDVSVVALGTGPIEEGGCQCRVSARFPEDMRAERRPWILIFAFVGFLIFLRRNRG